MSLRNLLTDRIRHRGPLTVAEYMDCVLYHPELGYYSRVDKRSGRRGDFFTSVDLGPVFGELIALQLSEMHEVLAAEEPESGRWFDLVEVGAGNGQLARDVLDTAARDHPGLYRSVRPRLVERSARARAAQAATLGPHGHLLATRHPHPGARDATETAHDALHTADGQLPDDVTGVILANELLDALPTHLVEMREDGLTEIYVDVHDDELVERSGPVSDSAIAAQLERVGARLQPGWRAEVSLSAVEWVRRAARSLGRGFLLVIDYGHEAAELYSASHARGTLATYHRHHLDLPGPPDPEARTGREATGPAWLANPGTRDLTYHVDLTAVTQAATDEGLRVLAKLDQTYFLLGLGAAERISLENGNTVETLKRRLALKTLLLPGGLGGTHKVLIFGKGVGTPSLQGRAYRERLT